MEAEPDGGAAVPADEDGPVLAAAARGMAEACGPRLSLLARAG
jgi:hypothetical protein